MDRPHRPPRHGLAIFLEGARGRVDPRQLHLLGVIEPRQDSRHGAGEQRLPFAGRSDQQEVVAAGRRQQCGLLGSLLAADLPEIDRPLDHAFKHDPLRHLAM